MEINAQYVIDSLLDQNANLTMQIAMLQAVIKTLEESESSDPSDNK